MGRGQPFHGLPHHLTALCGRGSGPAEASTGSPGRPTASPRRPLAVIAYDDDDEAVRIADGSPYGLPGGTWISDPGRALATAHRLRAGTVTLNGSPIGFDGPGGYKAGGLGREYGKAGLTGYTGHKSITHTR
ncbi:aldehyde dehydrogenase family protein [Streptomyces sp. NPDC059805]|uniref:aldehyde dehydrogenase family protein n=1 Tax=Streptomyces sp. NPDC059805 TaxID=3346954 RepID=UPI0036587DB5